MDLAKQKGLSFILSQQIEDRTKHTVEIEKRKNAVYVKEKGLIKDVIVKKNDYEEYGDILQLMDAIKNDQS